MQSLFIFCATLCNINISVAGIWDDVDLPFKKLSSLLRIRRVEDKDSGVFTCNLVCQSKAEPVESKKIEICVKDAATSLGKRAEPGDRN